MEYHGKWEKEEHSNTVFRGRVSRDFQSTDFSSYHMVSFFIYSNIGLTIFNGFKGSVSRDYRPAVFYHDSNPSGPLINRNRIRKYLSLYIRGPDGLES